MVRATVLSESLKEQRDLITSFYLGNVADVVITRTALLLPGFSELNPLGAEEQTLLLKMGVVSSLIVLYALSEGSKLGWSVEKSLKISRVLIWTVVVMNMAQVLYEVTR